MAEAPYGRWPNPIPAATFAAGALGFKELHGGDLGLGWVEQRPSDGGRCVLARLHLGASEDLTGAAHSVGSRVHEYGGSSVCSHGADVYFVGRADQRVYALSADGLASPLTPADARRYGDLTFDGGRGQLLAVCEDHRAGATPTNTIVAIPRPGGEPRTVVAGHDFFLSPKVSPDGRQLAWVAWDLPDMPWDAAQIYVGDLDESGIVTNRRSLAGGPSASAWHPLWSPDGALWFVSDLSDWWNLYVWTDGSITSAAPMAADVGGATAMGACPYDVGRDGVVFTARADGRTTLLRIGPDGEVAQLPVELTEMSQPRFAHGGVGFLGGSATEPMAVWLLAEGGSLRCVRRGADVSAMAGFLAEPETIVVPTTDGGVTRGFFYPPRSPHAVGPEGDKPPLIVRGHGGPVSAASRSMVLGQMAHASPAYWTSRGYAYLDVDHRGSTGYGRRYRRALYGRWGDVDVDDAITLAQHVIDRGDVAPRAAVRGGSAGGFLALAAVAFRDFFCAAAAYYPVADLEQFDAETHKFESRYVDNLVGADSELRRKRSPLHHAADIKVPVLILQGLDDKITPPAQSDRLQRTLVELGRDVEYVTFPGEGHGFTAAHTMIAALEQEARFFERVLT